MKNPRQMIDEQLMEDKIIDLMPEVVHIINELRKRCPENMIDGFIVSILVMDALHKICRCDIPCDHLHAIFNNRVKIEIEEVNHAIN